MNSPNESYSRRRSLIASFSITFITFTVIFHFRANATSSLQQVRKYEILHSFTGNAGYGFNGDTDGANPYGPLIQGPDGNFYGTTMSGSATATAPTGTVFKMTANGEMTILHHFTMTAGGDGVNPYSGLTLASDGNFYVTTYTAVGATGGGSNGGVVFRITPTGTYTKVFTFSGVEGAYPKAGVIQGKDGRLYGSASKGGFDGR